jgi:hypothetical protein
MSEVIKEMGEQAAVSAIATVSETIKEKAVDAAMDVAIKIVDGEDIKLDEVDMKIVSNVYAEAKAVAQPILEQADLSVPVKVTKLLAELMKIMEKTKHNGVKIPGLKKKAVALYLLRQLMKDVVADIPLQSYLLSTANTIGEHLLETLVDVSRNVNISEVATTCCMSLISSLAK